MGKKTAAQIVLDLKGKLQEFDTSEINLFPTETSTADLNNDAFEEAMEALLALGYTQRDVKKVRKQIDMKTELTTDGYIREALSKLMKK